MGPLHGTNAVTVVRPAAAGAPDGSTLVVAGRRPPGLDEDLYAQRYAPDGLPAGNERPVAVVNGDTREPAVALDAEGPYVVAWEEYVGATFSRRVIGRGFDAAGLPVTDPLPVGVENSWESEAAAASLGGGHFVVVWQAADTFGRRLGPDVIFASGFE